MSAEFGVTRRDFMKLAGMSAAAAAAGCHVPAAHTKVGAGFMWAYLIHLGTNTMCDCVPSSWGSFPKEELPGFGPSDVLRCDDAMWREAVDAHFAAGMNTLVIGLAEGVVYPSHPELAVKGSWSVEKLRRELARIRNMGVEVVPKLNFSAAHDTWLRDYGRMVSTETYYRVCSDVLRDVWEIFDHPRLVHLGYDEENWSNQGKYEFAVVRQGELWWHDFLWFVKTVEDLGMQAWIWTDCNRANPETFYRRMPRSVLQSNWYYGVNFTGKDEPPDMKDAEKRRLEYYEDFARAGFGQVPCGSNWYHDGNFPALARFCREHIPASSLRGMLMAPWFKTLPENRAKLLSSAREMAQAINGSCS